MNFDLNIQNYKLDELREIFDLPVNYDHSLMNSQETKLKETVLNNMEINEILKMKTIAFLSKAKELLIQRISENVNGSIKNDVKEIYKDFYNSRYELKTTELENSENHMIQIEKKSPFLSSFPSDFFPGVINPLKRRINSQNLNIDTRFRDNYFSTQSSNFGFELPMMFKDIVTMQLNALELPTSFYTISKQLGNNFFNISIHVRISDDIETFTATVHVTDGNYTSETLMTFLNTYLNGLGDFYQYIYFTTNLYNNTTGSGQVVVGINSKFTEDYPDYEIPVLTLNFQVGKNGLDDTFTPLPLKFGWILGFRNGLYVNNTTYVSEGLLSLTGPRYVYLVVDDYNNNVNDGFYSAFNSSVLNKNILARISLQSGIFNVFTQNNLSIITSPRRYYGPVNIQKVTIQLLDEYGRILDLNNMDYSFCLTFQSIYDIQ